MDWTIHQLQGAHGTVYVAVRGRECSPPFDFWSLAYTWSVGQ